MPATAAEKASRHGQRKHRDHTENSKSTSCNVRPVVRYKTDVAQRAEHLKRVNFP